MFNNPDLRSHSNLKLLLSTQVINLSVIITPINWVTKWDLKFTSNQTIFSVPWFQMAKSMLPCVRVFWQSTDSQINSLNKSWPFLSDTVDKRDNSVWYDINSECIHVDVWICWWRQGFYIENLLRGRLCLKSMIANIVTPSFKPLKP